MSRSMSVTRQPDSVAASAKFNKGCKLSLNCFSQNTSKVGTATEELLYLMNLNSSITQCMVRAMEHLSDFVFDSIAVTLVRRDSYLAHVKSSLK